MTEMESLERKFDDLSRHIPEYESDVWGAINSLEQASFGAIEKGKEKLKVAISRLNKIDELISSALTMHPLSEKANARLQQCLVSVRPRLNLYIEQLRGLIENPPTDPKYPIIDDIEIFERMESKKSEDPNDEIKIEDDKDDGQDNNNNNENNDNINISDDTINNNDNTIHEDNLNEGGTSIESHTTQENEFNIENEASPK
ncbi:hypothetical protein M9Y10_043307 [Tritrichomonas musculus]|uniref:Uncharacterized protein n=1 Tax=Tritrichomonas musculus TaxID=1915356 RepID=A0ABR2JZB1_9EUKA